TNGKHEGKRIRIYDGDTLSIKKVYSYATNTEMAQTTTSDQQKSARADERIIINQINQNDILSRLRKLKPKEKLNFVLKSGKRVRIAKAPKHQKGYYLIDKKKGKRIKQVVRMADIISYAQQLGNPPRFEKKA
ncbi:hypothetical protein J7J83_03640, partial [bacterium]|nr:hypothetical protein [bacterium]